jgi:predicted nucleotidyltransferase
MDLPTLLHEARKELLGAMPDAWACYAFGSVVRGDSRPDSDIDLAVLLPPGHSIPEPLQLAARLVSSLGRDVDLVDLRNVGDILRMEIIGDDMAFYVADPDRLLGWEAESMTDYAQHRERIRWMLDDFSRSVVG